VTERLAQAFQELANSIIAAVPKIVVGIVLFALALIVAKLVEKGLRYILTKLRFDELVGKVGIDSALQRMGIRQQLTIVLPRLTYFLVLLLLAKTAADALALVAISNAIGAFFAYLPNVVAALLLLVLGSSIGQFAGDTVSRSAESAGIDFAPALGRAVSGLILFVTGMMAIGQLNIDTEIVRIVTSLVLGGFALAFGLAFGLGTRSIVRNVAAGFYARKLFEVGRPLEVAGHRGILKAITTTHIVLSIHDQDTMVSNETLLNEAAKQEFLR
jgi:hypothetical protein